MQTILSERYWRRAVKNDYHLAPFSDDVPGLPAYAGEKRGDKLELVWDESPTDRHIYEGTITKKVDKGAHVILYMKGGAEV